MKKLHKTNNIIIHIVVFYISWSLYSIYILPKIYVTDIFLQIIFKIAIWILPVFTILVYRKENILNYLKLNKPITEVKLTFSISLFFIIYLFIGRIIVSHGIVFNLFFNLHRWIMGVFLAPVVEEILFRGFFLQNLSTGLKFKTANFINSLMFLLIHVPGWIVLHKLSFEIGFFVFVFSIIQGYVFKKTESLWSCILIHAITNITAFSLGA